MKTSIRSKALHRCAPGERFRDADIDKIAAEYGLKADELRRRPMFKNTALANKYKKHLALAVPRGPWKADLEEANDHRRKALACAKNPNAASMTNFMLGLALTSMVVSRQPSVAANTFFSIRKGQCPSLGQVLDDVRSALVLFTELYSQSEALAPNIEEVRLLVNRLEANPILERDDSKSALWDAFSFGVLTQKLLAKTTDLRFLQTRAASSRKKIEDADLLEEIASKRASFTTLRSCIVHMIDRKELPFKSVASAYKRIKKAKDMSPAKWWKSLPVHSRARSK